MPNGAICELGNCECIRCEAVSNSGGRTRDLEIVRCSCRYNRRILYSCQPPTYNSFVYSPFLLVPQPLHWPLSNPNHQISLSISPSQIFSLPLISLILFIIALSTQAAVPASHRAEKTAGVHAIIPAALVPSSSKCVHPQRVMVSISPTNPQIAQTSGSTAIRPCYRRPSKTFPPGFPS